MSLAYKCDRCQKFFSSKKGDRTKRIRISSFGLNMNYTDPIDHTDYDLCDSCAKDLKDWLNEYKKGEK